VVAIKRLLTHDGDTIQRFVSEVRMLARLRHPNLILFMGYCKTPELCIVSEYMNRGSLYSVLHSADQRRQRVAAAAAKRRQQQQPLGLNAAAAEQGDLVAAAAAEGGDQGAEGQEKQQQHQEAAEDDEVLEARLQRLVAISVARGMAYLHTRSPPILHLVGCHAHVALGLSVKVEAP
jgi:serine/threonine protein kinase